MKTVSLTINGKKIKTRHGEKILWVALENGIYIPNLCGLRDEVESVASCGFLLVVVVG